MATDPERAAEVQRQLRAFNDSQSAYFREARTPEGAAQPLEIYLEAADGALRGGLVCQTLWGWLYLDKFWLHESLRGAGWGRRLVGQAEAEARQRGCTRAHLRTYDFQARGFYEKLGYRVVGQLDEYPPGHTFFWMAKDPL
jgi:ribosomal protein S18 acetylase RimI-like enzyme